VEKTTMKLCIPPLGSLLQLNEEWEFKLFFERRNAGPLGNPKLQVPWMNYDPNDKSSYQRENNRQWLDIFNACKEKGFKLKYPKDDVPEEASSSYKTQTKLPHILVSLPAQTILGISRYYIRQGVEAFDSVTFHIKKSPEPSLNKGRRRFWARLQDVNTIDCELLG
jgi:hypothetical protein